MPGKQASLAEWRSLQANRAGGPRVFLSRNEVRFYFWPETNTVVAFNAPLERPRVATRGFQVQSSRLVLMGKPPPLPARARNWREAKVLGNEWRQVMTNLLASLTPQRPFHGAYYKGLFGERFVYRAADGTVRFGTINQIPPGVTIDHRYPMEETLGILATRADHYLSGIYPRETAFVLLAPSSRQFLQPLLVDRQRSRCVWLSPVDFFRSTEPGPPLVNSARSFEVLFLDSYGLALLKNPVSSVARLGNFLVQNVVSLLRLPLPGPSTQVPPLSHAPGMDLNRWETWLDHWTFTRQKQGSIQLLIDGERFFPRLQQAIAAATNHVRMDVYIFDNDDVATQIANQLKQRSRTVNAEIINDRLGSLAAARVPPATPPATNFVPPASITSYLKNNSSVHVRPFYNPFFSFDHSKVYLVDGTRAWLGGMNIGREYRYEWHDLMVELQGPVVDSLENGFRIDWAHAGWLGDVGYLFALLTPAPPGPSWRPNGHWTSLRLLPTKTLWKPFSTAVLGSLRHARSYIYLENAYLFDKRVITALVRARARGVDVRAVLPHENDTRTGARAEVVIANYLIQHGVRVYFYPGMTHVKALLVDDWACVGSGNLNQFSLRLCQEHNVATSDPVFASRLKHELFEADFAHSYELEHPISEEWLDSIADFLVEGL